MISRLEDLPNELLLVTFEHLDAQDIFYGIWGLTKRFDQLLQSLDNLSLTIEKDESKLISLFGCRVKRLIIDTCLQVDFSQFSILHTIILRQLTKDQFRQIQSKVLPHLTYLSTTAENHDYLGYELSKRVFSKELSSLRHVTFGYLRMSFASLSQSQSLRSASICCMELTIIPYILASSPNLVTLHMDFEKNIFNVFETMPSVTNHPLKYFILSDQFSVLCFKNIDTILAFIPNAERIKISFNCDVPFFHFARALLNRLPHLHRFDCHIDKAPDEIMGSIEEIHLIHPAFKYIQCTTDDYGYRTYTTN